MFLDIAKVYGINFRTIRISHIQLNIVFEDILFFHKQTNKCLRLLWMIIKLNTLLF